MRKDNPRYPDSMHYRYDNVITLRTFSKVYGLAGIRIGYGFAHEELIKNLLKVKLPFEPSTLAQAAGIGALADKEFLHRSLELNARGIRYLTESLRQVGPGGHRLGSQLRHGGPGRGRSRQRPNHERLLRARRDCAASSRPSDLPQLPAQSPTGKDQENERVCSKHEEG